MYRFGTNTSRRIVLEGMRLRSHAESDCDSSHLVEVLAHKASGSPSNIRNITESFSGVEGYCHSHSCTYTTPVPLAQTKGSCQTSL